MDSCIQPNPSFHRISRAFDPPDRNRDGRFCGRPDAGGIFLFLCKASDSAAVSARSFWPELLAPIMILRKIGLVGSCLDGEVEGKLKSHKMIWEAIGSWGRMRSFFDF